MSNRTIIVVKIQTEVDCIKLISESSVIMDLKNGSRYSLVFKNSIPEFRDTLPVKLVIGEDCYLLQDIIGNDLMSDQLRYIPKCVQLDSELYGCNVARMIYGNNPLHFKLWLCLPASGTLCNIL